MKLKNPHTLRTAAISQIIAAVISAIFLTIATWMTTSQIPRIEDEINNEEIMIKELRHQITEGLEYGMWDVHK